MSKSTLDVFPGEWLGTEHEGELNRSLAVGDEALVGMDSQFQDYTLDSKEKIPRRIGQIGTVIEVDLGDEWAYKMQFDDGGTNWFKRYHLKKVCS